MGGLFAKPKTVKPPPVPDPVAIPEVGPEVEEFASRFARRKRGFLGTIKAGALEPGTGKKKVLG